MNNTKQKSALLRERIFALASLAEMDLRNMIEGRIKRKSSSKRWELQYTYSLLTITYYFPKVLNAVLVKSE